MVVITDDWSAVLRCSLVEVRSLLHTVFFNVFSNKNTKICYLLPIILSQVTLFVGKIIPLSKIENDRRRHENMWVPTNVLPACVEVGFVMEHVDDPEHVP